MAPFQSQKAVTLMELLVAAISVSIIMVAVVSIDQALRQSHKGTSANALASMRASAIMLHITKNTQEATGDKLQKGILTPTDPGGIVDTLCVRKEDPATSPPTPGVYTDDIWVCYTLSGNNIYFCQGSPGGIPAACGGPTVVGTVINNPLDSPGTKGFTAQLVDNPTTGEFYVEVSIITRYDPAGIQDTFDNPEIRLTSRISPPAFGSSIE